MFGSNSASDARPVDEAAFLSALPRQLLASYFQRVDVKERSTRSLYIQGDDLMLDAGLVAKLPAIRYPLASLDVSVDHKSLIHLDGEAIVDDRLERLHTTWQHDTAVSVAGVVTDLANRARTERGSAPLPQTLAIVSNCPLVNMEGPAQRAT